MNTTENYSLEEWQIQDIKDGIAEADRGEFASENEVLKVFEKYNISSVTA